MKLEINQVRSLVINGVDQVNFIANAKMPKNRHVPFMLVDTVKQRSDIAFILGNGVSRKHFDLQQLHNIATTYGCNAIYRDFSPDYLISMDEYMVKEIISNNGHTRSKFYTQRHNSPIFNKHKDAVKHTNFIVNDKWNGDSGTGALRVACSHNYKRIYMIGFDYGTDYTDNVYYGTTNYLPKPITTTNVTMIRSFESRLRHWCQTYPNIEIIRLNNNGYKMMNKHSNYSEISLNELKERINGNNL